MAGGVFDRLLYNVFITSVIPRYSRQARSTTPVLVGGIAMWNIRLLSLDARLDGLHKVEITRRHRFNLLQIQSFPDSLFATRHSRPLVRSQLLFEASVRGFRSRLPFEASVFIPSSTGQVRPPQRVSFVCWSCQDSPPERPERKLQQCLQRRSKGEAVCLNPLHP